MKLRTPLALLLLATFPHSLLAQSTRLNGPLTATRFQSGGITEATLSPDGAYVVYRGSQDRPDQEALYSVPFGGGDSIRLSPNLDGIWGPAGRPPEDLGPGASGSDAEPIVFGSGVSLIHVRGFRITPDSRTVVFWIANPPASTLADVYARPIDGSGPARQLAQGVRASAVTDDTAALSGNTLVTRDGTRLIAASLDGSSPTVELATGLGTGTVTSIHVVGDTVVYWAAPTQLPIGFFHRVPVDGSLPPERIGRPEDTSHDRLSLTALPGTGRVAFEARIGLATSQLSVELTPGSPVADLGITLEPQRALATEDDQALVYLVQGDLLVVPADGSTPPTSLNDFTTHGPVRGIDDLSDGTVLYRASNTGFLGIGLFAVDLAGGPPLRLSGELEDQLLDPIFPAPALRRGSRVVFSTLQVDRLWSVSIDGTGPLRELTSQSVEEIYDTPTDRVVFLAEGENARELFDVDPLGTSPPRRLDSPANGSVQGQTFAVAAQADAAVYLARTPRLQVFGRALGVDEEPRLLNGELAESGTASDVEDFLLSPDGSTVAYVADPKIDNRDELFVVPLDRSRPPLRVSPEPTASDLQQVAEAAFSGDGRYLGFLVTRPSVRELFVHSVQGASIARRVDVPDGFPPGEFHFAEGGDRILFTSTEGFAAWNLFSQPTIGGTPTRLDTTSGFIPTLHVTPDGRFVLYSTPDGLRAVPVDGSAPAQTILPLTTTFQGFTPDGSRAILVLGNGSGNLVSLDLARGTVDFLDLVGALRLLVFDGVGERIAYTSRESAGEVSLRTVRVDGSEPPVEIASLNGDPIRVDLTPDGNQVFFTLVFGGLNSAAADGSSPPVQLPENNLVGISPDSRFVLFTGTELLVAPVDLSEEPETLAGPGVLPRDPRFLGDGTVVFSADQGFGRALFQAVLEEPAQLVRLTELPRGFGAGPVASGYVPTPDGRHVVFRSTHLSPGVIQLYRTETVPGLSNAAWRTEAPPLR